MEKTTPNKSFCIQPFINITTRIKGNHNVCCNIQTEDNNIQQLTASKFFNSTNVKQMRNDLLEGVILPACKVCHKMEENQQTSHRQVYNEYYYIKNKQSNEYYKNIIKSLKVESLEKPLYAEVHISNLCNLKCLTCNERDSSQFHAENKILGISEAPEIDYTKFVVNTSSAIKEIIHPRLLFLDIRGGETLMVPEIKKILNNVSDDIAKNITLKIQTNGTILPDNEWTTIFKKFKNTKINVSIDAYGEDNTYVRYPSNWQKILKTIEYLEEQNIKFIINTVVSNINILVLDKLLTWLTEKQYANYLYPLIGPSHYQATNLPNKILKLAGDRLSKLKNINTPTRQLINLCYNTNNFNKKLWLNFCKEIYMRDTHRKNNIISILPEIKEYFLSK
jgi:MoaA/NifB/PqqE/SkfB family radical SAM enzyme